MDDPLIILLALGAAIALWSVVMGARERALAAARRVCDEMDVALLDDAAPLVAWRPFRSEAGWRMRRIYEFRYLDHDQAVRIGLLVWEGRRLTQVIIPEAEQTETAPSVH
ncbi:DUF3301 domain-containing protein [Magnetofaba australis]|uniref:DUF3301 domain-containing protein n=1 Tax=Magnetofaba australis IT-1 TaxID=1434232 RepID=A0A1Y2K3G5_9PROT|nr:DUF3301 domain-containing protein [Magnetofaba australis]OSM02166.1 hypothetical protein MAIT1_02266 [Magnetofaba australis IT-1]